VVWQEAKEREDAAGEGQGATAESGAPRAHLEVADGRSWVNQSEVVVSLNVGGEAVDTSLATVKEGARQGGEVFPKLYGSLLGPGWEGYAAGGAVPAQVAERASGQKPFLDINPREFAFVLDFLRSGELPSGDTHMLANVRAWSTRVGMQALECACQDATTRKRKRLDAGTVLLILNGQKNLAGMDLTGLDLSDMDLAAAKVSRARFNDARLENASFAGAVANDSDFSGAILTGANFEGAYLMRAKLVGANFARSNLAGANLSGADLSGADLSGCNFEAKPHKLRGLPPGLVYSQGASFAGVVGLATATFDNLRGARLYEVNFDRVDLGGKDCTGASFNGAKFGGALNVAGAKGLHGAFDGGFSAIGGFT
jgi:uncharacterized protein YjbI with pentapeptide repeats